MTLTTRPFRRAAALALVSALPLSACASLPSSGPTGDRILRAARAKEQPLPFDLVELDARAAQALAAAPSPDAPAGGFASLARDEKADTIGVGDVLNIAVYEVGVSLFGGGGPRGNGEGFDPSARGERFPPVIVGADGTIRLPYIGKLQVAGRTTPEVERLIEAQLFGRSQAAQALVTLGENVSRVVYVSGDLRKPGRLPLTPNRERLLDAVAASGGAAASTEDTVVRFLRDGRLVEERLSRIAPGGPDDLTLLPGDRIQLVRRPRSYSVFGATPKVSQQPFETETVTLAEAVARVGGPNDNQADARAVFLFRDGAGAKPTVYRLNMLLPESYFVAQRVAMRDKDVLYIANARTNQPAKLFGILNLLFSPFINAATIANAAGNNN